MNINQLFQPWQEYCSPEDFTTQIEAIQQYTNETIKSILPNFSYSAEGQKLNSIFAVTNNYLCEIQYGSEFHFDISKRVFRNMRIEKKKGSIRIAGTQQEINILSATIHHHPTGSGLKSEPCLYDLSLSEQWLESLYQLFPVLQLTD